MGISSCGDSIEFRFVTFTFVSREERRAKAILPLSSEAFAQPDVEIRKLQAEINRSGNPKEKYILVPNIQK
jgi:hypothetical protein